MEAKDVFPVLAIGAGFLPIVFAVFDVLTKPRKKK